MVCGLLMGSNEVVEQLTCLQRPYKRISLSDEGPAGAEAEETNPFVARSSTEEVADKRRSSVVDKTDHGDCGE